MTSIRQSRAGTQKSGAGRVVGAGRVFPRIFGAGAILDAARGSAATKVWATGAILLAAALIFLAPGRVRAQAEDLDPLTRLERDLAGLDEEGVYRKAEALYLGGGSYDLTRRAYQEILNRFATGSHAPKAAFQLAMLGLPDARNWGQSIGKLAEMSRAYPDSDHGKQAARYHRALTDPKDALDAELLTLIYRRKLDKSEYPLYKQFLTSLTAAAYKDRPVLEWLEADGTLADYDKAMIAYDWAIMLYKAPDSKSCQEVCEWILKKFPTEVEPCAMALIAMGEIRMSKSGDLAGAEPFFRRAAKEYGSREEVPSALCRLAVRHWQTDDFEKAKSIADEVRSTWPESRGAFEAYGLLSNGQMWRVFGAPKDLTGPERRWKALQDWERGTATDLPDDLQAAQVSYCGPWAFKRVCEKMSVSCSPAEALRRCETKGWSRASSLGDVSRAFEGVGLKTTAQEMGIEELRALASQEGKEIILHMPQHYMVVESADDQGLVLSDFRHAARRMSYARLAFYWDGYLLCVEK